MVQQAKCGGAGNGMSPGCVGTEVRPFRCHTLEQIPRAQARCEIRNDEVVERVVQLQSTRYSSLCVRSATPGSITTSDPPGSTIRQPYASRAQCRLLELGGVLTKWAYTDDSARMEALDEALRDCSCKSLFFKQGLTAHCSRSHQYRRESPRERPRKR